MDHGCEVLRPIHFSIGTLDLSTRRRESRVSNCARPGAPGTSENWQSCGRRCMTKTKATVAATERQIDAALAQARRYAASDRRVLRAEYERRPDLISLYLNDGIRVSIPRSKLQRLERAEPAKVAEIEILGRGTGLHWPPLDVDHYVPGLLNRVFGTSRWMAELGQARRLGQHQGKSSSSPCQRQKRRPAKATRRVKRCRRKRNWRL